MSTMQGTQPPSSKYSSELVRLNPQLIQATKPRLNDYIPHTPFATQAAFLLIPNFEGLFGGQAFGGKSDCILMGALQYVDVPGYAALILRREFTDLEKAGSLLPRSHEWLAGTKAVWNEGKKLWTFPGGATLEFGGVRAEKDKYAYQSAEYQYIGFEELTQFTLGQYRYLVGSRIRKKKGVEVPLRARSSSNPGGLGHEWVKQRFMVEGMAKGRAFIPSRLEDNVHVDVDEYERTLQELDPVEYAQLRHGDWDAKYKGHIYDRTLFEAIDVLPADVDKTGRGWDIAATKEPDEHASNPDPDYTAGVKLVKCRSGLFVITDCIKRREEPDGVESLLKVTTAADGQGVDVIIPQDPAAAGKIVARNYIKVLSGYSVKAVPMNASAGNKLERSKPAQAQVRVKNVKLLKGAWNSEFLDDMEAFGSGVGHDDVPDAFHIVFNEIALESPPNVTEYYRLLALEEAKKRAEEEDAAKGRK